MRRGSRDDRQAADELIGAAAAARLLGSSPRIPDPVTPATPTLDARKRVSSRRDLAVQPITEKVAEVFGAIRKTQLERATATVFVRQALAYMETHQVAASVAVDQLLTPNVIREAARGLTGPLSDAALLEFARKGVLRAIEEATGTSEPDR
jgi:hypothetical protein